MILATRIALVVAETPEIPLPGVKVALYDRDEHSMDDFLGTGVTDEKGEVRIAYESEAYNDEEDLPLWKLELAAGPVRDGLQPIGRGHPDHPPGC